LNECSKERRRKGERGEEKGILKEIQRTLSSRSENSKENKGRVQENGESERDNPSRTNSILGVCRKLGKGSII